MLDKLRKHVASKTTSAEGRNIVKNSFWNGFAKIFSRGISLVLSIVIARVVGVEGTGQYTIAITYAGLIYVILNFGIFSIVQREIAKNSECATTFFSNGLCLFLYLAIPLSILIGWLTTLALPGRTTFLIISMACLYVGLSNLFNLIMNALEGINRFDIECKATIAYNVLSIGLAVPLLMQFRTIETLLFLNVGVFLFTDLFLIFYINRNLFKVRFYVEWKSFKYLVKTSFPLVFSSASEYINLKSDSLILGYYKGDYDTGIYSTASNIYQGISSVPHAVATAFMPSFTRSYHNNKREGVKLFKKTYFSFFLILFLIAVALIVCSKWLIVLLYGKAFEASTFPLCVLAIALIPTETNRFFNNALIGMGRQKIVAYSIFIGMILNVALNIIFIPIYTYTAAAFTTLFSESVVALIDLYFLLKYFKLDILVANEKAL